MNGMTLKVSLVFHTNETLRVMSFMLLLHATHHESCHTNEYRDIYVACVCDHTLFTNNSYYSRMSHITLFTNDSCHTHEDRDMLFYSSRTTHATLMNIATCMLHATDFNITFQWMRHVTLMSPEYEWCRTLHERLIILSNESFHTLSRTESFLTLHERLILLTNESCHTCEHRW